MANSKISALTSATTPLAGTETLPIVQSSTTKQVSVANLTAGRAVSTLSVSTTAGYTFRGADFTNYEVMRVIDGAVNPGLFVNARVATKDVQLFGSGSSVSGQRLMLGADSVVDSLRIGSADITVSYGNLIQGTAAKGINFTANTPAAGMTSQLLNWYEEGTWTPTQGAGLVVVGTFSSSGRYTRIGRQVTVSARLAGSTSIACTAGGVFTTGLPYAPNSVAAGAATSSNLAGTILYVDTTIYSVSAMAAAGALSMTATYSV
jgi:hypothetical protein